MLGLLSSSAYAELLRNTSVRLEALSGLAAQVTQGAAGVGLILVVRDHTGSLALAGTVVGALSIAAGMARPAQGRIIDRRGPVALMAVCGIVHAGALAAVVLLADAHAAGVALVILGVIAGVAMPPVSTTMRVEWGVLVPEQERTAAYSLVYLTQVLSILAGPLVLAAFIALADASVAVICVAGVAGVGTLAYAGLLARRGGVVRGPTGRHARVLGSPGVRALVLVAAVTGGVAGSLDVGVPTLAIAHHAPAASGLLMAAAAVGGIAGGVAYGSRRWSGDPVRRLLALQAVMTAAMALTLGLSGLIVVGAVLFIVGVALNPVLTTISVLVDRHVPTGGAAEAFGWLSLGISAGTGLSTAIAGAIAQHSNTHAAFGVGAVAGVLGLVAVAACSRWLRGPDG